MSYYEVLGLKLEPFSTSPDPAFFYESSGHKQALNNLLVELRLQRGMCVILGDIGTGKTTLSRKLIQELEKEEFIFHIILDPVYQDKRAFLEVLCQTLGIDPSGLSESKLEETIKGFLFQKGAKKNKTVVLIDEAQKLSEASLETMRILLNYETNTGKLLQLVLLGQLELYPKLVAMPNLIDRISFKHILSPLDRDETSRMIRFRVHQAGYPPMNRELFTKDAIKEIHRQSRGYPRQITLLCHQALKNIVLNNKKVVDKAVIKKVIADAKADWSLAGKTSRSVPISIGMPAGKATIKAGKNWVFLVFLLILITGGLTYLALNQPRLKEPVQLPPQLPQPAPDQTALIKSFYERTVEQLKEEQDRTSKLMAELINSRNNQQLSNEELVKQINQLNTAQEDARERIMSAVEEIVRAQSQVSGDNKELATRLAQLKGEFTTLLNNKLSGTIGRPVAPGEEIPEGVYTIRIIEALITSTDWTDNDLGTKSAPPDDYVVVYQNDKEIFKSKVAMDTRHPVWDEEFSLNWQKGDKLQLIIYDLDPAESEKILSWDNTKDKEFLFSGGKANRLLSQEGSYLDYQVFYTSLGKEK